MGYRTIHEDNEFSWEWSNQFHELEIRQTRTIPVFAKGPPEIDSKVIRIPLSVATQMVKELHDIIEFEEVYDAYTETGIGG